MDRNDIECMLELIDDKFIDESDPENIKQKKNYKGYVMEVAAAAAVAVVVAAGATTIINHIARENTNQDDQTDQVVGFDSNKNVEVSEFKEIFNKDTIIVSEVGRTGTVDVYTGEIDNPSSVGIDIKTDVDLRGNYVIADPTDNGFKQYRICLKEFAGGKEFLYIIMDNQSSLNPKFYDADAGSNWQENETDAFEAEYNGVTINAAVVSGDNYTRYMENVWVDSYSANEIDGNKDVYDVCFENKGTSYRIISNSVDLSEEAFNYLLRGEIVIPDEAVEKDLNSGDLIKPKLNVDEIEDCFIVDVNYPSSLETEKLSGELDGGYFNITRLEDEFEAYRVVMQGVRYIVRENDNIGDDELEIEYQILVDDDQNVVSSDVEGITSSLTTGAPENIIYNKLWLMNLDNLDRYYSEGGNGETNKDYLCVKPYKDKELYIKIYNPNKDNGEVVRKFLEEL